MPRKQPTLGTTEVAPLPTSFHEVLPGCKPQPNVFPLDYALPDPNTRRSPIDDFVSPECRDIRTSASKQRWGCCRRCRRQQEPSNKQSYLFSPFYAKDDAQRVLSRHVSQEAAATKRIVPKWLRAQTSCSAYLIALLNRGKRFVIRWDDQQTLPTANGCRYLPSRRRIKDQ